MCTSVSHDKSGCALIVLPDKKKTSLKSILLDIKLIFSCMGLSNVKKAMDREFKDVLKQAELKNRLVYLETSTLKKNIPWYEKFGFKI